MMFVNLKVGRVLTLLSDIFETKQQIRNILTSQTEIKINISNKSFNGHFGRNRLSNYCVSDKVCKQALL